MKNFWKRLGFFLLFGYGLMLLHDSRAQEWSWPWSSIALIPLLLAISIITFRFWPPEDDGRR